MSSSPLSSGEADPAPSDSALENELRRIVAQIYKSGKYDELTVNGVRIAAQENLGLRDGFFKEKGWKVKSKEIIEDEAQKGNEASQASSSPVKTPQKPSAKAKTLAPGQKRGSPSEDEDEEPAPKQKRRNLTKNGGRKKAATAVATESDEEEAAPPRSEKLELRQEANGESSSLSDVDGNASEPQEPATTTISTNRAAEASESELSELIDEEPKPKRRKKGPSEQKQKKESKDKKKRGRRSAEKKELDPNAEEIKRLQGWLLKCGIRKMWARELKPYDTPKEKIRHLKQMLADAGMGGRYSAEKASQIREARELAADLEAIQEGDKRWGNREKGEQNDDEEEDLPMNRRPRGLPNVDLLEVESDTD